VHHAFTMKVKKFVQDASKDRVCLMEYATVNALMVITFKQIIFQKTANAMNVLAPVKLAYNSLITAFHVTKICFF